MNTVKHPWIKVSKLNGVPGAAETVLEALVFQLGLYIEQRFVEKTDMGRSTIELEYRVSAEPKYRDPYD